MYNKFTKKTNPKGSFDYGCIMADVEIPYMIELQSLIKLPDLYFGDNPTQYGMENEPHVTLLYGIEETVPILDVRYALSKFNMEQITVTGINCFENEEFDVLKFDVDNRELKHFNLLLKSSLEHVPSKYDYNPHITIAYLNKGMGKFYVETLNERIKPSYLPILNLSFNVST